MYEIYSQCPFCPAIVDKKQPQELISAFALKGEEFRDSMVMYRAHKACVVRSYPEQSHRKAIVVSGQVSH
jgi:hypothetical protein